MPKTFFLRTTLWVQRYRNPSRSECIWTWSYDLDGSTGAYVLAQMNKKTNNISNEDTVKWFADSLG